MFSIVCQSSDHFSDMARLECRELSARSGVEDRNLGLEHKGYFLLVLVLNLQENSRAANGILCAHGAGYVCNG